ncbi:MAG: DUF2798 domain-containing protein [Lachnospiraceae bacterium]|nr:DUF2798 domain-containing protein [Lachnospiraceae bacterium]
MPKNRLEETVFTIIMVIVMVYAMICYNIALANKGFENFIFVAALSELPIMGVAGFLLDTFIAGPLAKKNTFKIFNPAQDKPIFIILSISIFSVLFMCPMMSFIATVLFKGGFNANTISLWIQTTALNLPMAFFWQLMVAGPLVRKIFRTIFKQK